MVTGMEAKAVSSAAPRHAMSVRIRTRSGITPRFRSTSAGRDQSRRSPQLDESYERELERQALLVCNMQTSQESFAQTARQLEFYLRDSARGSLRFSEYTVLGMLRKLALVADREGFQSLCEVFDPAGDMPRGIDRELEVAKALVWRLSSEDDTPGFEESGLPAVLLVTVRKRASSVHADAKDKRAAAVVLNAAIAWALGSPETVRQLMTAVEPAAGIPWFANLLARRAADLRRALPTKGSATAQRAAALDSLVGLGGPRASHTG